jgi:hypothetical protein
MPKLANTLAAAVISALATLSSTEAKAATLTLDFDSPVPMPLVLDPDSPGIVNGNCAEDSKPCLGVNSRGAATLETTSGTFSVTSFWFQLLGEMDDLIITTSNGVLTLLESVYGHNNGGQVYDASTDPLFQNITSLSFLTNTGNARVDDIVLTTNPAPIPLPAPALLLLGALGGLATLRRRRREV